MGVALFATFSLHRRERRGRRRRKRRECSGLRMLEVEKPQAGVVAGTIAVGTMIASAWPDPAGLSLSDPIASASTDSLNSMLMRTG
jgi:hypothetical protein